MSRTSPEVTAALAKATRASTPVSVWVLLIWLTAASILVLVGPDSPVFLRLFGVVGLFCVIAVLGLGRRYGPGRPDKHSHPQRSLRDTIRSNRAKAKAIERTDTLAPLTALDEAAATKVGAALDLIDGPLHTHLDDAQLNDTASAIRRSLSSLRQLSSTEQRAAAAVRALATQLTAAGVTPKTDAQWKTANDAASALRQRITQTVAELRTSADQIVAAWGAIQARQAEQAATRTLSKARNEAADATNLALQTQPDGIGGTSDAASSQAELTDAVDGVRSRLGALDELEDLSDKLAPLRNEVPDLSDPELLPSTRPRRRGAR
jgi:hypothetical protein